SCRGHSGLSTFASHVFHSSRPFPVRLTSSPRTVLGSWKWFIRNNFDTRTFSPACVAVIRSVLSPDPRHGVDSSGMRPLTWGVHFHCFVVKESAYLGEQFVDDALRRSATLFTRNGWAACVCFDRNTLVWIRCGAPERT